MRRWRVFFSMLFVLMVFVGFCFYYLKMFVVTKPHGIIVFIAPGVDTEMLTLARMRSTESKFSWFGRRSAGSITLIDSQSNRSQFADLPAIMTTLASGEFSSNGYLGLNSRGQALENNLIYSAQNSGRMTGLVTSGRMTSTGIAAFYARATDAKNEEEVLRSLLDSKINVLIGGGTPAFAALRDSGGSDLIKVAEKEGYILANTRDQLREVPSWLTWKLRLLSVIGDDHLPTVTQRKMDSSLQSGPLLADLVASAIQCLQYNVGGYFLVVEDPSIAEAASKNQAITAADQVLNLDWAIATARAYAGEKALIFVYSPYSVGGLQITGTVPTNLSTLVPEPYIPQAPAPAPASSSKKKTPVAPLPVLPAEPPFLSWHNGPGGMPPAPAAVAILKPRGHGRKQEMPEPLPPLDPSNLPQEPAGYHVPAGALPSAGYGLLFLSGPGLEKTRGQMDVRELHDLLDRQF